MNFISEENANSGNGPGPGHVRRRGELKSQYFFEIGTGVPGDLGSSQAAEKSTCDRTSRERNSGSIRN